MISWPNDFDNQQNLVLWLYCCLKDFIMYLPIRHLFIELLLKLYPLNDSHLISSLKIIYLTKRHFTWFHTKVTCNGFPLLRAFKKHQWRKEIEVKCLELKHYFRSFKEPGQFGGGQGIYLFKFLSHYIYSH